MSYTRSNDQILDLGSDTVAAIGKYLGYEYQAEPLPYRFWPVVPISPNSYFDPRLVDDEMRQFMLMGERDVLKGIGPISKKDYDYYESL